MRRAVRENVALEGRSPPDGEQIEHLCGAASTSAPMHGRHEGASTLERLSAWPYKRCAFVLSACFFSANVVERAKRFSSKITVLVCFTCLYLSVVTLYVPSGYDITPVLPAKTKNVHAHFEMGASLVSDLYTKREQKTKRSAGGGGSHRTPAQPIG